MSDIIFQNHIDINLENLLDLMEMTAKETYFNDAERRNQMRTLANEIKTGVAMAAYVRAFNQLGPNAEITRENLQVWWTRMHLSMKITEGLPDEAVKEIAEIPLMQRWGAATRDSWHTFMRIMERARLGW